MFVQMVVFVCMGSTETVDDTTVDEGCAKTLPLDSVSSN